jgi:hypothetical protein
MVATIKIGLFSGGWTESLGSRFMSLQKLFVPLHTDEMLVLGALTPHL